MRPLALVKRSARWLAAAGIAVACLTSPAQAQAQLEIANSEPKLELERPPRIEADPDQIRPFFEKKGRQRGCDYVEYRLRFGLKGSPAILSHPNVDALLQTVKLDFYDEMPNGLTVVDVEATGDGTAAGGGPLPAMTIGTTADPNDTAKLENFRLSGTDLDGSGEPGLRYVTFKIVAKIDHAAFPAPTLVDNQGWINLQRGGGPVVHVPSHDPGEPDDGSFLTGEKTSIKIDVTDCDPPPPPPGDGEPCFEVVKGEVDCVPGGGAFIYHMPVGPELGGKWVQLRTTTPGVTVAPAMQLVPGGGGVLNWTITGALPGDTVHLIVTGIETFAGPEEGVGLCCTQTVDIEIPEDLDCPPEDKHPDLKVEKRADVANCTKDGGCDFTIRVTNVGDADYNGPIVLDEVTLPGNASVSSGPNAPWVCAPMTSPMQCTHPATTLNPGESVDLKLGFTPGPAWDWPAIRNCAAYNYDASGKMPFGDLTNDKACASIPICIPGRDRECTPPEEKKADIGIRKSALTPVCSLDGVCLWRIDVINTGGSIINGPLTVTDTYPAGVPASSQFGPTPPWACVPGAPGSFTCTHPGVVLVPGASVPLFVKTVVGDGFDRDQIENCAEVAPVPGETNPLNNKSCAKARIPRRDPGQPAMRITKTCDAIVGAAVSYGCRITVSNVGTAAPSGPVRVNDAATVIGAGTPVQIQTVTPDGPEWACGPVPADTLSCQIPGAELAPGTSRHFDVTLSVSPNQRFENCARGSYGPAPGDDIVYPIGEACDQGGTSIAVEKTGDTQCEAGQPCTFEITIRNGGDEPFSGPVRIGDAVDVGGIGRLEGVPITSIDPPFGCSPEPATLPISCEANLSLGAGEARVHQVTIIIPEDALANARGELAGRNCVAVLPPNTPVDGGGPIVRAESLGERGERPYACHEFTITKPVKENQCSEGFVMNDAGRCACPEGTTFRNGVCTGDTPPPPPPPTVKQCTLLPGQIRTQDGRCVCPRGTTVTKNGCVKPDQPVQQCKLLPGQIRTEDGRCVCPRGTELSNGRCVKDEPPPVRQCTLLPGQIRTQDGRCICPRGTELRNGRCVKDEPPPVRQCKLLPGQIRTQDGRCICPRGTELRNGRCVKDEPPPVRQCKLLPGQIRTQDGRCVCPRGTELSRGACRKVEVKCPEGTRLVRGQCVKVERPPTLRCPKGQVPVRGQCMTIERKVPQQINPRVVNPEILRKVLPRREQPRPQ